LDRKGQTILYVYDSLNRLTQKTYPDSTTAEYTYDLVGKVLGVTDPSGTYGLSYDNMGRLTGTTAEYAFLSSTTFTNAYTYDADSNRTGYTAPDSSTNTYSYDTLNRLTTLANS
jgi:YD repeat-containing protein